MINYFQRAFWFLLKPFKNPQLFFDKKFYFRIYHFIFGEKFYSKLNFQWEKYPKRIDIIQSTINRKNYNTYLEIGCDKDLVFQKISINKKVGVDPISGGTIRDTSNNFFKFNKSKFDIIFIDGLHEYSQVKQDIKNSLNVLNDNGVIFLHDCMPMHFLYQAHPESHINFNGDVWKNIVEIRHETNLDTYVIYADHGIGMILKRPNKKLLNLGIKNYKKMRFKDYFYNYKNYLNLIYSDELKNIF